MTATAHTDSDQAAEPSREALVSRVKELEGALEKALLKVTELQAAHQRLMQELKLLKRRIFEAKAERADVTQLELEFDEKARELRALHEAVVAATSFGEDDAHDIATLSDAGPARTKRPKPTGRRRVADLESLPVETCELRDEILSTEGWHEIGEEVSWKLGWRVGGPVRIRIVRPKYELAGPTGPAVTASPMPEELFPRLLAAPSLLAHIAVDKFCDGLPLFRPLVAAS
jgi:hypothetical protein